MNDDQPGMTQAKLVDRRHFLTSLFGGLSSVVAEAEPTAGKTTAAGHQAVSFFWTNLQNGQIGFPTGTTVPAGQPGSLMKLVSAAALHETGITCHNEIIECHGSIRVNNHTYSCLYPHGKVELIKAIGLSCNVFFAVLSQKLSPKAFIKYARHFGLDTPIEGHNAELFPQENELAADSAQYALGLAADLRPNALQLLRLVAAIARQGTVPYMHNTGQVFPAAKEPFIVKMEPGTWTMLQQGMRLCARQGTAQHLDPEDKLQLAVKTGTTPHGKAFQSWIAGYFPYHAPQYAFCLRAPAGSSLERAVPEAHKWLFAAEWL